MKACAVTFMWSYHIIRVSLKGRFYCGLMPLAHLSGMWCYIPTDLLKCKVMRNRCKQITHCSKVYMNTKYTLCNLYMTLNLSSRKSLISF